jgi:hypothetical protein
VTARSLRLLPLAALLLLGLAPRPADALTVYPPETLTHQVTVRVIQLHDDAGANPAPLLGSALQQAAIEGFIDQIWAQAGIDIVFEASVVAWNDTFGLQGDTSPRPIGDLAQMVSDAAAEGGILASDPSVLNMFFVDVVPGSSQSGDNTVNGLAFLGGNGSAVWVGPNLPGFGAGQEVVASVLAHEIGHNLGLGHIVDAFNLMQASGQPDQGEQLDAAQIATVLASPFAVALPEASLWVLLVSVLGPVAALRHGSSA